MTGLEQLEKDADFAYQMEKAKPGCCDWWRDGYACGATAAALVNNLVNPCQISFCGTEVHRVVREHYGLGPDHILGLTDGFDGHEKRIGWSGLDEYDKAHAVGLRLRNKWRPTDISNEIEDV